MAKNKINYKFVIQQFFLSILKCMTKNIHFRCTSTADLDIETKLTPQSDKK